MCLKVGEGGKKPRSTNGTDRKRTVERTGERNYNKH